jgi:hypothetical protein
MFLRKQKESVDDQLDEILKADIFDMKDFYLNNLRELLGSEYNNINVKDMTEEQVKQLFFQHQKKALGAQKSKEGDQQLAESIDILDDFLFMEAEQLVRPTIKCNTFSIVFRSLNPLIGR